MRINFTKSGRLCYTNIGKNNSNGHNVRFKWLYRSYLNYTGLWSTFEPTVLQCIKKITLRNQFIRKPLCWVWRWKLVNKNKSNIFSHTVAMHVWKSKKGTIQLVIWVDYAKLNCLESFVKKEKWFQIFTVTAFQNTFKTSRQKTEIARRYFSMTKRLNIACSTWFKCMANLWSAILFFKRMNVEEVSSLDDKNVVLQVISVDGSRFLYI